MINTADFVMRKSNQVDKINPQSILLIVDVVKTPEGRAHQEKMEFEEMYAASRTATRMTSFVPERHETMIGGRLVVVLLMQIHVMINILDL